MQHQTLYFSRQKHLQQQQQQQAPTRPWKQEARKIILPTQCKHEILFALHYLAPQPPRPMLSEQDLEEAALGLLQLGRLGSLLSPLEEFSSSSPAF